MLYRWDDYSLDREGTLLTLQGKQIHVSRKVLDCISHLVEHRERVVSYDELIRKVWGHESVTNHQLSQIILAARRALGDDGQAQRLIRTMPGLGYRWIGEVIEGHGTEISVSAPASEPKEEEKEIPAPASMLEPETSRVASSPDEIATAGIAATWNPKVIALGLILFMCVGGCFMLASPGIAPRTGTPVAPADMITALDDALRAGNFEEVREGLATLPPHLADTPDARIIEIELDFYRGRLRRALEKVEIQLSRQEAIADPILRARLLILKGRLLGRMDNTPVEALALAQSTLDLIDSAGGSAPPEIRGQALERRASALILSGRLDDALRDLALANDLYKVSGDERRAINVKSSIARVWMRMGRLQDALNASREAAEAYRRTDDRVGEIFAFNTMTRIQMELLRWDDALVSNGSSMRLLREVPDAERRYRSLQLRAQALTAKGQLRLAASQLEEAESLRFESKGLTIPAFHLLESGDAAGALQAAQEGFDSTSDGDRADILLDSKEGALLLWIAAAQKLSDTGLPMPTPTAEQQQYLQDPKTSLGRIASGRWLWSQGKRQEAETEFRLALDESRRMNHLFRMTLAAEPLVEMLLESGETAAARTVATNLRALDPERMDGDYRANLIRLRVSLASDDKTEGAIAYRAAAHAAGERELPLHVMARYRTFMARQASVRADR